MRHVSCPICGGTQGVAGDVAMQVQCAFCRGHFLVPAAVPHVPLAARSASPTTPVHAPAAPAQAEEPEASRPPAIVPRGMWLEFTFMILFGAIFLSGLVVVLIVSGRWSPGAREAARVEEIVEVRSDEPDVAPRWSDATRISLQLDGVKTRIDHAEYGDVFARDADRRVVSTSDKYLTIWLHLENKRAAPVEYRSWYGGTWHHATGTLAARLFDDEGREYPLKRFDDVREVKGHVPRATLAMRDFTRDVIVFAVPPPADRANVKYFRLELPGAAFGAKPFLRFQIPLGLVEGW